MDYVLEAGATRNFEALRTAELMAQKEADQKEAELANNPMKVRWAPSSSRNVLRSMLTDGSRAF